MARRDRDRRSTNDNLSGRVAYSRHRRLRLEPLETRRLLDAGRLYVDADSLAADPDGTAWSAAYVDLQAALDQAAVLNTDLDDTNDINAIWIADGLYTPTKDKHNNATPDDPRTATFSMLSGVSLHGGFAGTEETLDDRVKTPEDTWLHKTILSGDLARNDDDADETTSEENAYTVIYAFELSDSLTLDALTITAGSADGPSGRDDPEWRHGAGVHARSSDITITNSTITDNSTENSGGGIFTYSGTLTVADSTLAGNSAHYGGGIHNDDGTLTVANSSLGGNRASQGGGIHSSFGTLTITNSTLAGNTASQGGGIRSSFGTLTITDSTLTGNSAGSGGGIHSYGGTLTVTNSTLAGNLAISSDGGGMNINGSALAVTNSTLTGNSAKDDGGGIYILNGTLTVSNSTVAGNSADTSGGGIYIYQGTSTLSNSIVYSNSADDIRGRFDGSNNLLGIDPGFVRSPSAGTDGVWGTDDDDPGDLRLIDRSPAINLGDNLLAVDADGNPLITDLAGNPRIADGAVDVGAYEYQGPPAAGCETPSPVVSVTHDKFDLYDGDITLREAIYYGQSGIGDGTVTFDATLDGATITLAGSELVIYQSMLIDASALSSLTVDADGRSRVFYVTDDATFRGLTITGGLARIGGGIYSDGATLTVTNATIVGNSAEDDGGGICSYNGTLTVTNSTVTGNSANSGGGIYSESGVLTVINSTLAGNSAGRNSPGGGIRSYNGTLTITNSTLAENSAGSGGGIYISKSTATVINSTLAGNAATDSHGGGIRSVDATLTVTNSTLAGNSADTSGGGIHSDGALTLRNSIVYLNSAGDIWGSFDGSNNLLGLDPGFVRSPSAGTDGVWGTEDDDPGDLHLTDKSPAINLGDNRLAVDVEGNPLITDVAGNPRIADDTVDIGAYEYQGPPAVGRETPSLVVSAAHDAFDLHDGDITLREAIHYGQSGIGDGTVTFDATLDGATITLAGSELVIHDSMLIDASALSSLTVDADRRSRVFHVTDDATLRGLTITGGLANHGGGIHNDGGTLTVTNSTIAGNSANYYGGGIYSESGTLTVTNSTIAENSAKDLHDGTGGGIYSYNGTLTVTNSTLTRNSANDDAGGIYSYGTSTVSNSTLVGNSAHYGGGIYSKGSLTVINSTIGGNSARHGGGIYGASGTLAVTNSTLTGNLAYSNGGGIYGMVGTLTVTNSTLAGNSAYDGGGIYSYITMTVTNSTLVGNSARGAGGGIYSRYDTLTVTNSTLAGNSADEDGGGIYSYFRLEALHNTVVAGNGAGREAPDVRGSVTDTSSYNLIGDGSGMSGIAHGENGNLVGIATTVVDPRFVRNPSDGGDGWGDDPNTPDIDEGANDDYGDLRLTGESPAIDAGDNALVPEGVLVDLDGNPRILDGENDGIATIDIGAYEYFDAQLLHPGDANFDGVTDLSDFNIWNANKFADGTTWATGDFNGDGVTDLSDFNIWNAHKFTSAPQPAPVVYEPTVDDRLWADPAWLDELVDTHVGSQGIDDVARQSVSALLATYWQ